MIPNFVLYILKESVDENSIDERIRFYFELLERSPLNDRVNVFCLLNLKLLILALIC